MTSDATSQGRSPGASPDEVWRMFDRIARRYDLLNRLLSCRRDVAWRRKLAWCLPDRPDLSILDLATGTGDVLATLHRENESVRSGVGMDMAPKMLEIGRRKLDQAGLGDLVELVRGNAMQLGFADDSFDAVTMAFGIRNVPDVPRVLGEMRRVLKPAGRALVLEFSLPKNGLVRWAYTFYLRHILPWVGGIISGEPEAYRYLNRTIEGFPHGPAFTRLMEAAGFVGVTAHPLTFGIATIYQGDKRAAGNER